MTASAIVLIEAERSAMLTIGGELAAIAGVASVFGVTGEWDFVVVVDVDAHDKLRAVVSQGINSVPGVARTQTLVALDTYEGSGGAA